MEILFQIFLSIFQTLGLEEKHHKRRVFNEEFLNNIYESLNKETNLIFQTDQKILYLETRAMLKSIKSQFKFRRFFFRKWKISSYWEDMKKKEGSRIYRLRINKK